MADYEFLDVSAYCNAGKELYDSARLPSDGTYLTPHASDPPRGKQQFRGLPFLIGPLESQSSMFLIGLGQGLHERPFEIPVGKPVHSVVFAHALLQTDLWQGGTLGRTVARYRFHLEGPIIIDIPIRERFEIGHIPLPWGQHPFLCVPDQADRLEERYQGRWERAGFRQTEVIEADPQAYYLWAWKNPHPDRLLQTIEIVPAGPRVALGAITLGYVDEHPLLLSQNLHVKLSIEKPSADHLVLDPGMRVDRGLAKYLYTLPADSLQEIDPSMAGFGAPSNPTRNPSYTEIAAIPSATIAIQDGNQDLAEVQWDTLIHSGEHKVGRARLEVVAPGKDWVHVTVVDEDTHQPLPCRIAFLSPEGIPYQPHGHHAHLNSDLDTWNVDVGGDVRLGQITYAYIDGRCQGWLPRGRVLVDAACGYEYQPIRLWAEIEPGQRELVLRMKRWVDMKAEGYFSGDTHVHFLSPQGALMEAKAEDLQVVNLLQSQWGHLFTNTEDFSGRPLTSSDGATTVYVSQENRQHILGHLSLLGLKEPVMPWCTGGPGEAELGGAIETTLSHWADAAHAQDATVILPHFPAPNAEAAVLVATQRVDAVEMVDFLDYEHREYYRYLNAGYRLPLVGGTDKMSSETPVGLYRTYVRIPADTPFSFDAWRKSLVAGRTVLSGGALLWFQVEGQEVGATLQIKGGGTVEVEAVARSIFPLHCLQIVQQGRIVAEVNDPRGRRELVLRDRISIQGDTWLAARCAGPNYTAEKHFDVRRRGIMAHTSPIYVQCGDAYQISDPATLQYMLTLVEGSLEKIRSEEKRPRAEPVTHHHGQLDHLRFLEEPFHQAIERLHRRLHQADIAH